MKRLMNLIRKYPIVFVLICFTFITIWLVDRPASPPQPAPTPTPTAVKQTAGK